MAPAGVTGDGAAAHRPGDLAGRDRMVGNVLASWVGHSVFIMSGFLMPRLLDRYLGQQPLGVWDLCWSIVSYFSLMTFGIGTSVNRYVARNRAEASPGELASTVSCALTLQLALASLALGIALTLAAMVARLFPGLGDQAATARWVLVLLGIAVAVQMATDSFRGVITGCHRWALHNGLNSSFYAVSVAGMIGVLLAGGSLVGVAAVYTAGVVALEAVRVVAAHRVCPELRVSPGAVTKRRIRELIGFGTKAALDDTATLVLTQTNSVALAATLGPAALAVFARPAAICRQIDTLVNKLAFVVAPSASALQRTSKVEELRELFLVSSRASSTIAAAALTFIAVLGDLFLRVWMGPRYSSGPLLAVLAIGSLLQVCQRPAAQVLVGLNMHGRTAITTLACVSIGLVFVWRAPAAYGLVGAAVALTAPIAIGDGIIVPVLACRALGVRLRDYFMRVIAAPFAAMVPYATLLVVAHGRIAAELYVMAAGTIAAALASLAAGIWILVLTPAERQWINRTVAPIAGLRFGVLR